MLIFTVATLEIRLSIVEYTNAWSKVIIICGYEESMHLKAIFSKLDQRHVKWRENFFHVCFNHFVGLAAI